MRTSTATVFCNWPNLYSAPTWSFWRPRDRRYALCGFRAGRRRWPGCRLVLADGLLLTITGALSHDVHYRVFRPASSTQLRLVISKSLLLVVAVLAATVAAQKPGTILSMVAWAFSIAGSAFFPALVLGIFWRRATRAGALAGMIVGFSLAAYYIFRVEVGSLAWLGLGSLRMQPWFQISSTAAGVFGVAAGFATVIVVSLFTKAPDKEVERFLNAIRRASPAKCDP